MVEQEQNSILLKMPLLVIEKILSNINNRLIVSLACKCLYGIVCGMERQRRIMYIKGTPRSTSLTIDDDAVFDSIMNSHRAIKEIKLHAGYMNLELNERQLKRLTAIMKRFAATIKSFKLRRIAVSINPFLQLLHHTPELESLIFDCGRVVCSAATVISRISLQLSNLKVLEVTYCPGLSDIVNLIPAGSLKYYFSCGLSDQSTDMLKTIVTKQRNIKSLHLEDFCESTVLCVNHLQLETLTLGRIFNCNNDELVEILKCHTNLKELRFTSDHHRLSQSSYEWICDNLKKLEVFEVGLHAESLEGNIFECLAELKKLRRFRLRGFHNFLDYGFQFESDALEKLEITGSNSFTWNNFVCSIIKSFSNLTYLKMESDDYFTLGVVLRHCTTITQLTIIVADPNPQSLKQQCFPNIKHLTISFRRKVYQSILSDIVHVMPNLKSLSISNQLRFDIGMTQKFIKRIKKLDYFYVYRFILDPELPADDFIKTIRHLLHKLNGYQLMFDTASREELKWRTVKEILSNEYDVQNFDRHPSLFYLCKLHINARNV